MTDLPDSMVLNGGDFNSTIRKEDVAVGQHHLINGWLKTS
jgi:hypothetical protein